MIICMYQGLGTRTGRSYARKSEQVQSDSIPLDITLEIVIGLSLAMVAVLKIGGRGF